jgi:cytochrome c-type biogenesis protein CcmH
MTLFWITVAALTALALLFLLLPLARTRLPLKDPAPAESQDARVAVYRAQLADLEADREAGVISQEQFNTAQLDLQRNLLETSESGGGGPSTGRRSWRWPTGIASLVAVPVLAVLIYQHYGAGAAALDPQARAPQQQPGMMTAEGIQAAVMALNERLEANPEDPDGWALLGRSLMFLNEPLASAAAYAQAIRYGGDEDPDILLSYADILGSLDGGDLNARAWPFIERALSLEPNHVNGLWLAGLAAYRGSDYTAAQDYWQKLEAGLEPGSEEALLIRRNLDEIESRLNAAPDTEGNVEPAAE